MKKNFLIVLSLVVGIFFLSGSVFADDIDEKSFPIADGVDSGVRHESSRWFMSSYDYSSSWFVTGVYLDGGNAFEVDSDNNPYFEATHNKIADNNPDIYRVSYQAIYDSTGAVRQGISFFGPIDDVTVKFDINEDDLFRFYIAGDGSNEYEASGTLYYGGF